ncbi:hypothetical protein P0Y35_05815 [Kiritimatiellaeota bacterium B1221]|nr:hypothetical protein [Kiritimatiellaeota bacterium B1221]
MKDSFIIWTGWFFGFAGFLFGWWQHRVAAGDRRDLAVVRRRANAPYLIPGAQRFNNLYDDHEQPGSLIGWGPFNKNVLCAGCREVGEDVKKGDPVVFVVDNSGKACHRVSVELDGEKIAICQEPEFDDAQGIQFIKYPFDPALRGKGQTLKLRFECEGVQDTHLYRTVHGKRVLERIDPA